MTGTSVSSLNGLLSATGSLYLLNPNGVIVGKSGVVNVGGSFVASTLNVSDANFLAGGDLQFTGSSNAAVVNLGKVGALGGDLALIAASVDNEGSITAANGTAGVIRATGVKSLRACPGVRDVAAFAVRATAGEDKAHVALVIDGDFQPDIANASLRSHFPRLPLHVMTLPAIPRNAMGKAEHQTLRRMAAGQKAS